MTATDPRYQPDDPGPRGIDFVEPLVFDGRKLRKCPSTVSTIRRNAGKLPAITIAQALGWSFNRLRKVAAEYRIPLRYPPDSEKEPEPRGA